VATVVSPVKMVQADIVTIDIVTACGY